MYNLWSKIIGLFVFFILLFMSCKEHDQKRKTGWANQFAKYGDTITVTASAYNTVPYQTKSHNPKIGAWGDTLNAESNIIAVSRDLLSSKLSYESKVKIKDLKGFYYVKDKMNRRWKNKIDILMGDSIQKAKDFGVQSIDIYFINMDKKDQTKTKK